MVCYEPPSGWNLPPGCFEGDPNAPWNREEPKTCGDCSHLLEGCCDYGICELEFEEAFSAQEAKERAEEQLRQKQSIQEYHRSKASLARAMERLKAGRRDTPIGY